MDTPQIVGIVVTIGRRHVVLTCTKTEHPSGAKFGTTWLPNWDSRAIEDAVCLECEATVAEEKSCA